MEKVAGVKQRKMWRDREKRLHVYNEYSRYCERKAGKHFFHFMYMYKYIFFFGRSRMTRRSRIYVRSRLNVLTKFVKRQHGDFSFFFFFFVFKKLVSEISARWKDLSGIYNTGSIQKSNWLTSFPVEFSIFPPKSNFDIRSRSIIIITTIRKL